MNSSTVALIAALSTAIGTILGVVITSIIQSRMHRLNRESEERTNRLNRESEERKHYREIVVKAAIENWKQIIEISKSRGGAHVMPLESFIIAVAKSTDVIFDPTTDETNIAERLDKANAIVEIAEDCATERTKKHSERRSLEKRSENESGKA